MNILQIFSAFATTQLIVSNYCLSFVGFRDSKHLTQSLYQSPDIGGVIFKLRA